MIKSRTFKFSSLHETHSFPCELLSQHSGHINTYIRNYSLLEHKLMYLWEFPMNKMCVGLKKKYHYLLL